MGATIRAFLQFDDNSPVEAAPFTNDPSTWDLSFDLGMRNSKDYRFYAAISGIRNETGLAPLIRPRGLPRHDIADPIHDLYDYLAVSYLTYSEITAALAHMRLKIEVLSKYVQFVLEVMALAERRLGIDRCRLVFGFSD